MARTLTAVAIGLIALGVVAMIGPTLGFSTVAGDRSVNVAVADPANALVGIAPQETTVDSAGQETEVAVIEDNSDSDLDIAENDIEVTFDDTLLDLENIAELENGAYSVRMSCDRGNSRGETAVRVTVQNAVGTGIAVQNASNSIPVSVTCGDDDDDSGPAPGEIEFVELTATVTDVAEGTGNNPDAPSEVEFTYEAEEQPGEEGIVFTVSVGDREGIETVFDRSGTVTVSVDPKNKDGFPAVASANIDGGESCDGELNEADEPVELCD